MRLWWWKEKVQEEEDDKEKGGSSTGTKAKDTASSELYARLDTKE